jgi:hypothetical protein
MARRTDWFGFDKDRIMVTVDEQIFEQQYMAGRFTFFP